MKYAIQENLKEEIGAAHSKAIAITDSARASIEEAVKSKVYVATLIQKASRIHKHSLKGYLQEFLSGKEVQAYMSLYDASRKRDALQDKRQLQLCGILDSQEVITSQIATPKPQQGFISVISKTIQELSKRRTQRPISEWGEDEREQVRDVLQPLVELAKELEGTPL